MLERIKKIKWILVIIGLVLFAIVLDRLNAVVVSRKNPAGYSVFKQVQQSQKVYSVSVVNVDPSAGSITTTNGSMPITFYLNKAAQDTDLSVTITPKIAFDAVIDKGTATSVKITPKDAMWEPSVKYTITINGYKYTFDISAPEDIQAGY